MKFLTSSTSKPTLVVGATGRTGRILIKGLIDGKISNKHIYLSTRHPNSNNAKQLMQEFDVNLVEMNLDDYNSICDGLINNKIESVYVHGHGVDTGVALFSEESRALNLATAINTNNITKVVYNSCGGPDILPDDSPSLMIQKRKIENIYSVIPTTVNIRPTLFMEELWKEYTRPYILEGYLPFANISPDVKIQLVSVYDVGKCSAYILRHPKSIYSTTIELAGDELSVQEICDAFSHIQNNSVIHSVIPNWILWLCNHELYKIQKFLNNTGYSANITNNHPIFKFHFLTFEQFLEFTNWNNESSFKLD